MSEVEPSADRFRPAFARLNRAVDNAVMAHVGTVLVTTSDLNATLDRVRALEGALNEIAAANTPPQQHGHYLAHREAARAARAALRGPQP